ncbi:MAG: DUF4301 family protein [Deltaproteobacteria bacterium]|nr:DUF4301 family protein [Deltaproteobacteria bacterium]
MEDFMLTDEDLQNLRVRGLTESDVMDQLAKFRAGVKPLTLDRPCRVNDGITALSNEEAEHLAKVYDKELPALNPVKFVPASGAASRMFSRWFQLLEGNVPPGSADSLFFLGNLSSYPFFESLQKTLAAHGNSFEDIRRREDAAAILRHILGDEGLKYGLLPKALIPFHRYPEEQRTSIEEHLVEAALYAASRGLARLHFTVSPEHHQAIRHHLDRVTGRYEERLGVTFDITLSEQSPSTEILAADLDNRPFRAESGELLFRPGGHGTLLRNLCNTDGDIVFIKNIDNVVPDSLKEETVRWKKILAGLLITIRKEFLQHLDNLKSVATEEQLDSVSQALKKRFPECLPDTFLSWPTERRRIFLTDRMDRPLRICGMVKNEGEPGGGPFWVQEADGTLSLQIVESAQINPSSPQQTKIWESSSHFNPVDIVCATRDSKGNPYDLMRYADQNSYLISRKSFEGRALKALELPGLWNGSMAQWNTLFVEVPLITFNPVKTVEDLLRREHLG